MLHFDKVFGDMPPTRRSLLTTAAAGVIGLTGCLGGDGDGGPATTTRDAQTGTPAAETTTATSTPTPERTDVDLLLNWKPSGLHVPYYAAKARGYYADEGFDAVEIVAGQGSDFSAKQVAIGNNAFAITSSDQTINVNSRDLSPRAVGVVMQKNPAVVFTAREEFGEPLESVDQLAGKTVGTGPGMVRILTKLLFEREGVLDEVELVDTGYDTVQQLLAGKVDAAGGVFGDAISARAQGATVDSLRVADTVPSYGHVVATSQSLADQHPETVRAFLRATARGAAWGQQHPEAAVDLLVDANQALEETRAQQREKWTTMAADFMLTETVREECWGWSRAEPWAVTHEALADADLLGGSVDPSSVWTNEFLDRDYRYIGSYAERVTG